MGNSADSQVDEEGYSFQWQVPYMKARGTFSAKTGTWKGKGLDLGAEPHKTMLGISNWGPCIWQNPFLLPTLFKMSKS